VVDEIVNAYLYADNDQYGANLTYHHDRINSVTALTDHTGSIAGQDAYNAFGERISHSGSTANILGYTGRAHDEEANLIYYRARFYDPEVGRFISEDPLGFEAGVNFYAYVQNNPVMFNDPMGLEIRVYSSDAFGVSNLNHAYVWSTETGRGKGRAGGYGSEWGNGVPDEQLLKPEKFPYVTVSDLKGMTETEFMDKIETYPGWNSFWWVPWEVDCHSELEGAFSYTGVAYPGAPGGRTDIDEIINTQWNDFTTEIKSQWNNLTDKLNYYIDNLGTSIGSTGSASGGFVIYPNKPNTNMMKQVYSK